MGLVALRFLRRRFHHGCVPELLRLLRAQSAVAVIARRAGVERLAALGAIRAQAGAHGHALLVPKVDLVPCSERFLSQNNKINSKLLTLVERF